MIETGVRTAFVIERLTHTNCWISAKTRGGVGTFQLQPGSSQIWELEKHVIAIAANPGPTRITAWKSWDEMDTGQPHYMRLYPYADTGVGQRLSITEYTLCTLEWEGARTPTPLGLQRCQGSIGRTACLYPAGHSGHHVGHSCHGAVVYWEPTPEDNPPTKEMREVLAAGITFRGVRRTPAGIFYAGNTKVSTLAIHAIQRGWIAHDPNSSCHMKFMKDDRRIGVMDCTVWRTTQAGIEACR